MLLDQCLSNKSHHKRLQLEPCFVMITIFQRQDKYKECRVSVKGILSELCSAYVPAFRTEMHMCGICKMATGSQCLLFCASIVLQHVSVGPPKVRIYCLLPNKFLVYEV